MKQKEIDLLKKEHPPLELEVSEKSYEAWVESLPDGEEDYPKQEKKKEAKPKEKKPEPKKENKETIWDRIKLWYYTRWLPYWIILKLSFSRSDKVLEMFLQGVPEEKTNKKIVEQKTDIVQKDKTYKEKETKIIE